MPLDVLPVPRPTTSISVVDDQTNHFEVIHAGVRKLGDGTVQVWDGTHLYCEMTTSQWREFRAHWALHLGGHTLYRLPG